MRNRTAIANQLQAMAHKFGLTRLAMKTKQAQAKFEMEKRLKKVPENEPRN